MGYFEQFSVSVQNNLPLNVGFPSCEEFIRTFKHLDLNYCLSVKGTTCFLDALPTGGLFEVALAVGCKLPVSPGHMQGPFSAVVPAIFVLHACTEQKIGVFRVRSVSRFCWS